MFVSTAYPKFSYIKMDQMTEIASFCAKLLTILEWSGSHIILCVCVRMRAVALPSLSKPSYRSKIGKMQHAKPAIDH